MSMYYNGKSISAGASAYDLAVLGGYSGTEEEFNKILATVGNKADKSTTLSGYGISDAYTKSEVDSKTTVDSELLTSSTNPVQNKVIYDGFLSIQYIISNLIICSKATIATTAWGTDLTCTVSVSGVIADNVVIVSPTSDSLSNYVAAQIQVVDSEQTTDTLKFKCVTKPTVAIEVNVIILNPLPLLVPGEEGQPRAE